MVIGKTFQNPVNPPRVARYANTPVARSATCNNWPFLWMVQRSSSAAFRRVSHQSVARTGYTTLPPTMVITT